MDSSDQILKLSDITVEGWYWWRWDEYRYWEMVFVRTDRGNPQVEMPLHHASYGTGEFIGPLVIPSIGKVGRCGWGTTPM